MGNIQSEFYEALCEVRREMNVFQSRLAGLEKDVSNLGVTITQVHGTCQDNSNHLLNLSLLEEGRSTYRRPKRYTASTYR